MITISSAVEIQNVFVNLKSGPIKSNSGPIELWTIPISISIWGHFCPKNFHLSMFPAKISDKIFKNKEKKTFWGHFCPKKIFPINLSGISAFNWQKDRVDWPSNQILFHHYQHAKIIYSICSIHQIISEIHRI